MIDELLELKKKIIGQIESIEDTNYYNVLFCGTSKEIHSIIYQKKCIIRDNSCGEYIMNRCKSLKANSEVNI